MPNATSTRRTRPVDASSAPAASRLAPMRVRALRQLNRVVRPLARRCYIMPQPKKRSLSVTKNGALASHVKAARGRSAAATGASSSAEPIVEVDAGEGARCTEMRPGHRLRVFAHARKLSHAGDRGSEPPPLPPRRTALRRCSKGAAWPAHGRAMVDVGRVRNVGRGRPRPLSCRARARIAWRAAPGAGTTTGADGTGTRKARAVW